VATAARPTIHTEAVWPLCAGDTTGHPCGGVRATGFDRCLAHLPPNDLEGVLAALGPGSDLDARGVPVSTDLLDRILNVFRDADGSSRFGVATFSLAQFTGSANFDSAQFQDGTFNRAKFVGNASFKSARFELASRFNRANFQGEARFDRAKFKNAGFNRAQFIAPATFSRAEFNSAAGFDGVRFAERVGFNQTVFLSDARFNNARFADAVGFNAAQFNGNASFNRSRFANSARFGGAQFGGVAQFEKAFFRGSAEFNRAKFIGIARFANANFLTTARFIDVTFANVSLADLQLSDEPQTWQFSCEEIDGSSVKCSAEINLQLTGRVRINASKMHCSSSFTLRVVDDNLTVENLSFEAPTLMASDTNDRPATTSANAKTRLLSLNRVDATNLTLAGLDLSPCRFLDCYNRDLLRIDGRPQFASQADRPWWTRRQVLAEEHLWRARYDRRPTGWFPTACRHPGETFPSRTQRDHHARLEAARIQSVYRDLRKGREDAKDEPGAADFYFGEMEMRRLAAHPWSAERLLLSAYWAIAGYGLRSSRAFAIFLGVLILTAEGFASVGFVGCHRPDYLDSLLYASGSVLSLSLTSPHNSTILSTWGGALHLTLRVAGPTLLALGALAIRGRVKR
jgi:Pentapeptide repeats (9 copies)